MNSANKVKYKKNNQNNNEIINKIKNQIINDECQVVHYYMKDTDSNIFNGLLDYDEGKNFSFKIMTYMYSNKSNKIKNQYLNIDVQLNPHINYFVNNYNTIMNGNRRIISLGYYNKLNETSTDIIIKNGLMDIQYHSLDEYQQIKDAVNVMKYIENIKPMDSELNDYIFGKLPFELKQNVTTSVSVYYYKYLDENKEDITTQGIFSLSTWVCLIVLLLTLIYIFLKSKIKRHGKKGWFWDVDYEELFIDSSWQQKPSGTQIISNRNGLQVFVKLIKSRKIPLTQAMREEIYELRELRHPNLTHFIGICYISDSIGLITEYVGKGSLKEILAHKDHKLEFQFKYSLISDLIKGMLYLHQSNIGYHGLLTSRKCLVSSRWELKITDFGLREVKKAIYFARDYDDIVDDDDYNDLLWTAPECIHIEGDSYQVQGYQKGDIYSIGIILNEIMTREYPFSDFGIPTKDIIRNIVSNRVLRPTTQTLNEEGVQDINKIINACWKQDPDDRPAMSTLAMMVRDINPKQFNSVADKMVEMVN